MIPKAYEDLKCESSDTTNKLWKCVSLKCGDNGINCYVIFVLKNIETSKIVVSKRAISQSLYFSLAAVSESCGLFELYAYIQKEGFEDSPNKSIHFYEMIPETNINNVTTLQKRINESDKHIFLEIDLINNIWKTCLQTELEVEIDRDLCPGQQQQSKKLKSSTYSLYEKNNITGIVIDLGNGMYYL